MLQYATAMGLPDEVFNPVRSKAEPKEIEIRERLLEFVKSLHPPFEFHNKHLLLTVKGVWAWKRNRRIK